MSPKQPVTRELRFLVTQRCNYNCVFCHGEGLQSTKNDLLTPEDIRFLYSVGRECYGITTATLTGGEPLVRKDIIDIANELKKEFCNVTITTNGSLLGKCMHIGNYIKCINLSVHTLKCTRYEEIVQRQNVFHKMIFNLKKFREMYPDVEICLNIALVDGINSSEEELIDLINFAESINSSIKFIELFPPNSEGFVPLEYLRNFLLKRGFEKIPSLTRKEKYSNGSVVVGLIKIFCAKACEMESPAEYCNKYNDLFVSLDGKIKPCRSDKSEVDVLEAVKARDFELVEKGLKEAFELLGKKCIYERRS